MYHFRDLDSPTWLDIALYIISIYICVSVKQLRDKEKCIQERPFRDEFTGDDDCCTAWP